MSKEIKLLEDNLINKIAAGEVIERPASVVKELAENSIDAGATNITIEIQNGGTSFIKITDNGTGIKKADVKKAFLRHATSKITKLDDLDSILTLGFRGEALASIAAISQLEIITKTKDEDIGTKLYIAGGNIISEEDFACLNGTSFTIKNIFFNTPARRKFLKKDSVESGYISEIINRLALGHPHISFKYINNNSAVLQTLGNGDIKNTIFNIYGKEIAKKMVEISAEKNGFKLNGFIGLPELSRGNRNYENFFISGRYIKSTIVTNAVEEAYADKMMIHKFPVFIINLTVPKSTVDVNVHPTKLEVRFENEDFIFEFIKSTVEKALQDLNLIPKVAAEENIGKFPEIAKIEPFQTEAQKNLEELLLEEDEDNFKYDKIEEKRKFTENISEVSSSKKSEFEKKLDIIYPKIDLKYDWENKENILEKDDFKEDLILNKAENRQKKDEQDIEKIEKRSSFFNNYKIIGQIFNTYWIVEQGKEIFLIDQHSAHEKAIYEDLIKKSKEEKIYSQKLLQPIIVNVSDLEKETIEENFDLLLNFGFDLEIFGPNSYAIRQVPFIFKSPVEPSFFIEILDTLMDKKISNIYEMKLEKIISISCKKAVKANDKLSYIEAKALIEKILKLENPFNCPHGRPTIIKMSKYEIEKLFKRIQN